MLTRWCEGPIFRLTLGGEEKIFITTQSLMDEVCNEKRFSKLVAGSLAQIRNGVQDGLFTAHPGEHNWEIAHRVLMPGKYQMAMARCSLIRGSFADEKGISVWSVINSGHVR